MTKLNLKDATRELAEDEQAISPARAAIKLIEENMCLFMLDMV